MGLFKKIWFDRFNRSFVASGSNLIMLKICDVSTEYSLEKRLNALMYQEHPSFVPRSSSQYGRVTFGLQLRSHRHWRLQQAFFR